MARKRKTRHADYVEPAKDPAAQSNKYSVEETFADLEDDFFAGRDEILLDYGSNSKRQRRIDREEAYLQPSDEEVLQHDLSTDDASEPSDEEDDRVWGGSKADYYDADIIETEADALEEEQEARRLQQKQLQNMTEADFGFDESQWPSTHEDGDEIVAMVSEHLPGVVVTEDTTVDEKLVLLKNRYPEFEPLAADFTELGKHYEDLKLSANAVDENSGAKIKLRALSAYLGAIAMYFTLFTDADQGKVNQISAKSATELREHPVMDILLRCRKTWSRVSELREPKLEEQAAVDFNQPAMMKPKEVAIPPQLVKPLKKSKKTKVEPVAENLAVEKKNRRREKKNELAQLLNRARKDEDISDFGDELLLTAQEAAKKARKKKSLRFYTSQFAQKSNKRSSASREAGGDDDVPRKERLKDRQARLQMQAERRGREALDDTQRLENAGGVESDHSDDYYNKIIAQSKNKKAVKRAQADALSEETQRHVDEKVGTDGKRAVTYAIAKNKGLMPKRKKEVRNPRVKKRRKFDEKKKKLGSVRAVWKGGERKGGYSGEITGIKTNVVKSVKL